MANKSYSEKLKHPKWQRKRLEIMQRDGFKCKLCGDDETSLNIHHVEYSDGEPWEIDNEKLITICDECHLCIHEIDDQVNISNINSCKTNTSINGYKIIFFKIKKSKTNLYFFTLNIRLNKIIERVSFGNRFTDDLIKLLNK